MSFHLNIRSLQSHILTSIIYFEAEISILSFLYLFILQAPHFVKFCSSTISILGLEDGGRGRECAIFTFHVRHWNQKCANLALIYNNELNIPFLPFFVTKETFYSNETRSSKQPNAIVYQALSIKHLFMTGSIENAQYSHLTPSAGTRSAPILLF